MLSFYPRHVRKILTRRAKPNQVHLNPISEMGTLKAPKHRTKIAKNLAKMHGLAVCQMNMMQILLQKISRRSKVIRKREQLVNDNLKRKRIYLERENFDLMSFLRNSLEAADNQLRATASEPAEAVDPIKKPRTPSDFTSTVGTKSCTKGTTQSIQGSTTVQNFGENLSLMDGFNSRKTASVRDVSLLYALL